MKQKGAGQPSDFAGQAREATDNHFGRTTTSALESRSSECAGGKTLGQSPCNGSQAVHGFAGWLFSWSNGA